MKPILCMLGRHKWKAPVAVLQEHSGYVFMECEKCGSWWTDCAVWTSTPAALCFKHLWGSRDGWMIWTRCMALGTVKDEREDATNG